MNSYSVEQLKKNRAASLVFGGTDADRRAFAVACAEGLPGEGLLEVRDGAQLLSAFAGGRGVAFLADAGTLSHDVQRELVRVLRAAEERAKLVLGLGMAPATAVQKGLLREDLAYWLSPGTVDVRLSKSSRK